MQIDRLHAGDPRFDSFPPEPGIAQLRWYVTQTAAGVLTIDELVADFRALHEASERLGPTLFASPAEARATWDVLWAVEFCSPTAAAEQNPEDWYSPEQVLAVVQRAAARLHPAPRTA
jgi:hypothetical protein